MPEPRIIKTLIVDDDADDRRLLAEAIKETRREYEIVMLGDGHELVEYLNDPNNRNSGQSGRMLIILDLNMPRMNGMDALRVIKSQPELKTIPVVVMSTSRNQRDVREAYRLGAASFITKPISFSRLLEAVEAMSRYWCELVELPGSGDSTQG
jgi:two-component system response regulator